MRNASIAFTGIGTDSRAFASRLLAARLYNRTGNGVPTVANDLGSLTVNFIGVGHDDKLQIEDIATLALIVRSVAEAQCNVTIVLPGPYRGQPSRIYRFLERLGFCELFDRPASEGDWFRKVSLVGRHPHSSQLSAGGAMTTYIPLRWFSKEDFSYKETESVWHIRPTIAAKLERQFRSLLQNHGLVDTETIDLLNKTMFVELGWNTVLHSSVVPGAALGVFCGHIDHWRDAKDHLLPPRLTFCIADIGRGIPNALRASYRAAPNPGSHYHLIDGFSEDSGIVRYALDPESTSRPDLPSSLDREGFRGLGFVCRALQGVGDMQIRSDGGAVRLTGHPEGTKAALSDDFKEARILGTQVIGHLRVQTWREQSPRPLPMRFVLEHIDVHLVCESDGECPALATDEAARQFASKVQGRSDTLIFDVGYADDGPRSLEYLCKSIVPLFPGKCCVFWNVRTPWSVLDGLENWLVTQLGQRELPPLFVRAHKDARVLAAAHLRATPPRAGESAPRQWLRNLLDGSTSKEKGSVGTLVPITAAEFAQLTNEINSAYLENGFRTARLSQDKEKNASSGFFTGNIHLLKGGAPVARYFSLTKNVSCARDANLRRWLEGFFAAVVRLLEKAPVPDSELILLGFTATMREVLTQVFLRLGRKCRAYTLLTYDIPSSEEIESKVRPGDKVILLTDVISTGTLVESVHSLIRKVKASVIGIACLVDIRHATDLAESEIEIERRTVPMITCGQLRTPAASQAEFEDAEYWVDPVSLVPSRDKPWGWDAALDTKIERTLHFIRDAGAGACGHVVDGSRHTSVYVSLHKLLDAQDLVVAEQISAVCHERLQARKWDNFCPNIVLCPSGIARIESVDRQDGLESPPRSSNVYQTAVRAYAERLVRIWPGLVALEVPRAFDPGGVSRCAKNIEMPKTLGYASKDLIVADDGIWRGTTVIALTQIALRLGAKRILVAPLLARLSPGDAEHFESLHSIRSLDGSNVVEVCYAFPLLLPIPYYGVQECPYEITISRLQDRRSPLRSIARITNAVISDLRGHTPAECPPHSARYCDIWVKLRTYVELASEHQGVLEKLTKFIETIADPEALLAMFALFSEEWRLLGRARLRQTVRVTLQRRASRVAVDLDRPIAVRTAAITVLRSLFRENFVELLPQIAGHVVDHPDALGRVVMQVATLSEEWRSRNECIHFLEVIGDRGPSKLEEKLDGVRELYIQNQFELVTDCKNLSLELRLAACTAERTQRDCANELLHVLTVDPTFRHNARPFVETLANSADSIRELKTHTFISFDREWREEHEPRLTSEVVFPLKAIYRLLLRVGTQGHGIMSSDLGFLERECETLRADLVALTTGLAWLKDGFSSVFIQRTVVAAALRLMGDVLSHNSTTLRLLKEMRRQTTVDAIKDFADEVHARFEAVGRKLDVTVEGLSSIDASSMLFISPDIVSACFGNVLDNLMKYAFPEPGTAARVGLFVEEYRDAKNEPMLSLYVKNNGAAIASARAMGSGGQRAASDLKLFGGKYFAPHATEEQPWRVSHRMDFPLW